MIEVNEYVRTKDGISKVIENVDKYVTEKQICVDFISGMYHQVISKHNVAKHSKQLIDLIEVGDIVNGYRVENVINEGPCPSGKCVDIDSSKDSSECTLWEEDIQTILTKESYMANCNKVGGEDGI